MKQKTVGLPDPPRLTDNERHSAVWTKVTRYYEARLESLRRKNDAATLNERDTAAIRGQIAKAKHLLALGDKDPGREDTAGE